MNLKGMKLFKKYKVSADVVELVQRIVDGDLVDTYTVTETLEGFKYNRSTSERYFSQTWASDVSDLLVMYSIGSIIEDSLIDIKGVRYTVDSVDDTAITGEVYTVGLRVHK